MLRKSDLWLRGSRLCNFRISQVEKRFYFKISLINVFFINFFMKGTGLLWFVKYVFRKISQVTTSFTSFFYKRHFYKQHQAKIGKNQAKTKQHPEPELRLFENYSHSSFMLSFKTNTVWDILTNRSSHQRCSVRKSVLRNFAKFTGKHLCQNLIFNKVAGLCLQLY